MSKSIESITPLNGGNSLGHSKHTTRPNMELSRLTSQRLTCPKLVPKDKVLGSNDRLQRILALSRVNVTSCRPNGTLIHTGPDGSAVLTNEIGWGLPNPEPTDLYIELDDRYMCYWEITQATWTPEAPYWATCLDY